MRRTGQDVPFFAALGLLAGIIPGLLAAGAYLTWVYGGNLAEIDVLTIYRARGAWSGQWGGFYETALGVGLGVIAAFALLGAVAGYKPRQSQYGSAQWATARQLRRACLTADRLDHVRGPVWGKFGPPRRRAGYLSSNDIVHSMIVAPTGAGKGVGIVIPTLLTYCGSIICLDVKGENFAKTARRRQEIGDRVFRFAPYDPDGHTHCFNPLDEVAEAPERRRFSEGLRLANGLIAAHGDTQSWIGGAREIFAATAVHAVEKGTPTIAAIYDLLARKGKQQAILQQLGDATEAGDARSTFYRYAAMPNDTLGSYISILFGGGLQLWADRSVRDATSRTDFHVRDFRSDPASVYICVGQKDLAILAPVIRLLFTQMFSWLQENDPTGDDRLPVLFLLDEFASLGAMNEMSRAITTVRSSGAHLMFIVQSMANLRLNYGADGAANFLGNCDLQLFMAPTDLDTPDYVSRAIGEYTRAARSKSWRQASWNAASFQERLEGAKLIRPEDIRMLGKDHAIALVRDCNPVLMNKVVYYQDSALRKVFERQSKLGNVPLPVSLEARASLEGSLKPSSGVPPTPSINNASGPLPQELRAPGGEETGSKDETPDHSPAQEKEQADESGDTAVLALNAIEDKQEILKTSVHGLLAKLEKAEANSRAV